MGIFSKDNDEKAKGKGNAKENGEKNMSEKNEINDVNENVIPEKEEKVESSRMENNGSEKNNKETDGKIIELEKQLKDAKDQLLRKVAEFENYKRRTENEFSNLVKNANEYLIIDLLPVLDDFERSFDHAKDKPDFESFYKGIELIYAKLAKTLEQKGVKPITAVDQPFDVNYHEAILMMPKSGVPSHTVLQEVLKGYTLYEKVIRHTKVIVSSEPPEPENNGSESTDQNKE
jgi:molecular chaperone GrpE